MIPKSNHLGKTSLRAPFCQRNCLSIPPKYAVSEVIDRIKAQTASILRKQFAWLENVYWKENIVWSPDYFVSTVGLDETKILNYVRWQQDQDSGQAKLDL